jgi:hypothetical protein
MRSDELTENAEAIEDSPFDRDTPVLDAPVRPAQQEHGPAGSGNAEIITDMPPGRSPANRHLDALLVRRLNRHMVDGDAIDANCIA